MKVIDRALKEIRDEVTAALQAIADKHGLTYDLGTMRFDSSTVRARVEFKVAGFVEPAPVFTPWKSCEFKIGDTLQIRSRQYKVTTITSQGGVRMDRLPDGRHFRLPKSMFNIATKVNS